MSLTYLTLEIRRTFRSTRYVILAVAFPVVLFLLQANVFLQDGTPHRDQLVGVFMVNMMAYGAFGAALSGGGRLALERAAGWQRQLRLTPLSGGGYLGGKTVAGMLVSLPALILVPLVGVLAEGVSLDPAGWVRVVAGIWLGAIPLVLLGLVIGQFATPDSMQGISILVMMVFGFAGGLFIPIDAMPDWLRDVSPVLPTYWLTQIGRGAVTTDLSVDLLGAAAVLAAWTVVLGAIVVRRYRRDSARG